MTDYPISLSMASALRLLRAYPEFLRQPGNTWAPEDGSPIISRNTMETLIRRGHVAVIGWTLRGAPHAVKIRQEQDA